MTSRDPGQVRERLEKVLEAFDGVHVLVVGDVVLDEYLWGSVDRLSPEAPVPVVHVNRESVVLGGAGNVVHNLAALGAGIEFITVIGDDDAGDKVAGLIANLNGTKATVLTVPGRPTTVKSRYIADGQQLLRADRETEVAILPDLEEDIGALFDQAIANVSAVVMSDYGKGALTTSLIGRIIDSARAADKPVVVDPKGSDYSIYRGASTLTPNRRELAEATRMAVRNDREIISAARQIIAHCAIDSVLVTRGSDGMTLVDTENSRHLAAEAREVFDVSGAGDTVVAVVAGALAAGDRAAVRVDPFDPRTRGRAGAWPPLSGECGSECPGHCAPPG